ncbi:carbohydrate-binding protein [Phytoactinopolyspora mesophila]|uniref:carbohydrate-binding protein n=1 Tax=Phytoactinopolyspora mesophila TaxID=2650750 RepID=UPI0031B5DEED
MFNGNGGGPGDPDPEPPECEAPAWSASAVYLGGDTVSHEGVEYRARWWTQGEEPAAGGAWDVWEAIGDCVAAVPVEASLTAL